MSLSVTEQAVVTELATLLYEFLPASGKNATSFPLATAQAGLAQGLAGSTGHQQTAWHHASGHLDVGAPTQPHTIMRKTAASRRRLTSTQEQGAVAVIPALPRTNEVRPVRYPPDPTGT